MATATLQPDGSVFALTNLTGAATDVDEGVDTPDGVWLDLIDDGTDCIIRASFPTPSGDPTTGAGLQKFRLYARVGTAAGGNDPMMDIAIRETGGGDLAVDTAIPVTSHTGEIIEFTWDASVLGTADGSAVEIYIVGQRSGGSPSTRRCVELDAVEWVVDYAAGGTTYDETGLSVAIVATVAGAGTASMVESGAVSVAAVVAGSDTRTMTESATVAIAATVTGNDTLNTGSTAYDETGQTVTIVATVAGTDVATFTESLTVAAASTVTGTDNLAAVEFGIVAIVAAVAGTDVVTFVESDIVAINASVTGTDIAMFTESGTVATVTSVVGIDSAIFVEAATLTIVATVTGTDTIPGSDSWHAVPIPSTANPVPSTVAAVDHTRMH